MLIDWFTVGAQALNFAVLIWLMKRFLYRPVLEAIDARAARTVAELHAAREQQEAATRAETDLLAARQEFEANREAGLRAAKEEVSLLRDSLLKGAREEEVALRLDLQRSARRAADAQRAALARRVRASVFDVTRKALGDLASVSLESQLVATFARHVASLPQSELDALQQSLGTVKTAHAHGAVVRSAFALEAAERSVVRESLAPLLGDVRNLQFEVDRSLLAGVEVHVADRTVGWSMAEYLDLIERSLMDPLSGDGPSEPPDGSPDAARDGA